MVEEIKDFVESLSPTDFMLFVSILVIGLVFVLFLGVGIGALVARIRSKDLISEARKDAVKRSRAVLNGQLNEQFAAYLPGFPANAMDSHFLGKPVDFICFSGLNEKDEVDEIILIEVKTGQSTLSAREKSVKNAIENGRVRYEVYNVR